jgi:hypothetical protein
MEVVHVEVKPSDEQWEGDSSSLDSDKGIVRVDVEWNDNNMRQWDGDETRQGRY